MKLEAMYSIAGPMILMQFLALVWTVSREVRAADAHKQGVIALPDVVNIMSLFATIAFVIVSPMATRSAPSLACAGRRLCSDCFSSALRRGALPPLEKKHGAERLCRAGGSPSDLREFSGAGANLGFRSAGVRHGGLDWSTLSLEPIWVIIMYGPPHDCKG